MASAHGSTYLAVPRGTLAEVARQLDAWRPDIIALAGFPWLLDARTLGASRLGALNVHTALLPRHRGILPLFWIYRADDRETGVTVHWATEQADAGDIVAQESFVLARGRPVDDLNRENATRGASLMRLAITTIEAGTSRREPQDAARATHAPWVRAGTPMINFATWGAERVWHFLAGLSPRWTEPLWTHDGARATYVGVRQFDLGAPGGPPGSVERSADGWRLACRDGWVSLVGALEGAPDDGEP